MINNKYNKRGTGPGSYTYLLAAAFFFLLVSCSRLDVYEKNTLIPGHKWQNSFFASGSFDIPDTIARYNIYLVLRHTDAYRYNNIWLNIGLQQPGDSMRYQKLDLRLATDATGWEGSGMSDVWEVRKMLNSAPQPFRQKGVYRFSIAQIMRDNPLLNVASVGLRVEKVDEPAR